MDENRRASEDQSKSLTSFCVLKSSNRSRAGMYMAAREGGALLMKFDVLKAWLNNRSRHGKES
jgi:hypothetical protein